MQPAILSHPQNLQAGTIMKGRDKFKAKSKDKTKARIRYRAKGRQSLDSLEKEAPGPLSSNLVGIQEGLDSGDEDLWEETEEESFTGDLWAPCEQESQTGELPEFSTFRRRQVHILLTAPEGAGGMIATPAFQARGDKSHLGMQILGGFLEWVFSQETREIWGKGIARQAASDDLADATFRILMDCAVRMNQRVESAGKKNLNDVEITCKSDGTRFFVEDLQSHRFSGKFAMLPWGIPFCLRMLIPDGRGIHRKSKQIFRLPELLQFYAYSEVLKEEAERGRSYNDQVFCDRLLIKLGLPAEDSERTTTSRLRNKWKKKIRAEVNSLHTISSSKRQTIYNKQKKES